LVGDMLSSLLMVPFSLYLHIPFCITRCSYCDFNTSVNRSSELPGYIQALTNEIETTVMGLPHRLDVHSIYFGGGTPALTSLMDLEKVMDSLRNNFHILANVEVTIEANPGSLEGRYIEGLNNLGFNRLSLGMQSADPVLLKLLGRRHNQLDVIQAVKIARSAGVNNISLDLIFGVPTQTMASWRDSLEQAIALNVDHFSLYALTLEGGTPLYRRISRGLIPAVDDDLAADMYEIAGEMLEGSGFESYEISNWARRSKDGSLKSSRHNMQYWTNLPYLGFGAGAHGFASGFRLENISDIDEYIHRLRERRACLFPAGLATAKIVPINQMEEMRETMMVGLRLTEKGVSNEAFQTRFGRSLTDVFQKEIEDLIQTGLLEWGGRQNYNLRLTRRGRLLGNRVFMQFVGEGDDQETMTGVP
jgi:oxygen-independent coproporphyrinogen-3 oxidase